MRNAKKEEKHLKSPADSSRAIRNLEGKFSNKRLREPRVKIKMKTLRCSTLKHPVILGDRVGVSKHLRDGYKGAGC